VRDLAARPEEEVGRTIWRAAEGIAGSTGSSSRAIGLARRSTAAPTMPAMTNDPVMTADLVTSPGFARAVPRRARGFQAPALTSRAGNAAPLATVK